MCSPRQGWPEVQGQLTPRHPGGPASQAPPSLTPHFLSSLGTEEGAEPGEVTCAFALHTQASPTGSGEPAGRVDGWDGPGSSTCLALWQLSALSPSLRP